MGSKAALRKFLGSVGQKWISQNSTMGDPLGRQGVESLWGGGGGLLPRYLSTFRNPSLIVDSFSLVFCEQKYVVFCNLK